MTTSPTSRRLPSKIVVAMVEFQEAMGWPELVPAFACLPDVDGKELWSNYKDLTIADCEQLVKHHTKLARVGLGDGRWRRSPACTRGVAEHIVLARLYRCAYISRMGQQNTTEDDMPFAHNKWEPRGLETEM